MTPHQRPALCDSDTALALTPARTRLLQLMARLPLAPVEVLARLRGTAGPAAVYRHLERLRKSGLIAACRVPLGPRLSSHLWHPTDPGLAALGSAQGVAPATLARAHHLGRTTLLARLRRLPSVLALYHLLGALAAAGPGAPLLLDWEAPWRSSYRRIATGARIVLHLPARVAFAWETPEGSSAAEYLLLPDLATAPLAARRDALDRLFPCRLALERAGGRLPALLVATDARRAGAWAALLEDLRAARRDTPLLARIATWDDLDADVRDAVTGWGGGLRDERPTRHVAPSSSAHPSGTPLLRLVGRGPQGAPLPALLLRPGEWALLDLLARHPLLPRDLAARALGWADEALRRRRRRLIEHGLVRLVPIDEFGGGRAPTPALARLAGRELAEATSAGLAVLAAWQGLTLGAAVRWNGLAGGGPATPVGTRTSLLAAPFHTLGIEEFFAHLARHGHRAARRGADEGLVEWRNAAACARGRFRPDGYVVYRRGGQHHAAFLEYDRGTMGARDWEQKLVAYFDYRDSGRARRDYAGFPALLIVVAANRDREPAIEGQLAELLRRLAVGRAPLPALLTTATRLLADPSGELGPVWREPDGAYRRPWLRAGASIRSPDTRQGSDDKVAGGGPNHITRPGRRCSRAPPRTSKRLERAREEEGTAMINHYLSILTDELRAEGIGDPLAHPFTLAALWGDLATLAGEAVPTAVGDYLGDDTSESDAPMTRDGGKPIGWASRAADGP